MTPVTEAPPQGVPLAPVEPSTQGGIGVSIRRPDGNAKVRGEFVYSSDLHIEGMLWGTTLRSPHAAARIVSIDTRAAAAMPGVSSVLTHRDVPGVNRVGLEIQDQPVLAEDEIRYQGEAVAIVAADHPETARRAAAAIKVTYEAWTPVVDSATAMADGARTLHPDGNILRHVKIRHGAQNATAPVVVRGTYTVGMQDQAFLGPESGLAVPDGGGGVDLYIATQWLHIDQKQLATCLGLPPEQVRLTLAGVGGAFGAREDLSMQAHACMLALACNRPVKMMYSREESFFGHVHRHPAVMEYEHGADRQGKIQYVNVRIVLDGGAYASSSTAVASNAACFALGPYDIPSATIDSYVLYTNNPPCGAMRGFGAVQTCFAHEAQMDKLAAELQMDPVELRIRNAMDEGSRLPTGQVVEGAAPVRQLLEIVRAAAPVAPRPTDSHELRLLPGGVANSTHGEGVRRGVGFAVGFKNTCYSEGFDDHSTARVELGLDADGDPTVSVHTAAVEVGQGLTAVQVQIARTELGIDRVRLLPADTRVGSAGSSSASRQTYMTGGAVRDAAIAVRDSLFARVAAATGGDVADFTIRDGDVVGGAGAVVGRVAEFLLDGPIEETREYHHKRTSPIDVETGQGDAHVQLAFAAHRATLDVDAELGLVRVLEIVTAQDVGKAIHPLQVEGQIEGGIAQGLGLALMEEIQVRDGMVRNPSFTDYLIPTILDMPSVEMTILELGDPDAPYGLRGIGEPPAISSPPAIVAALRQATGKDLIRIPVRPDDIVGLKP